MSILARRRGIPRPNSVPRCCRISSILLEPPFSWLLLPQTSLHSSFLPWCVPSSLFDRLDFPPAEKHFFLLAYRAISTAALDFCSPTRALDPGLAKEFFQLSYLISESGPRHHHLVRLIASIYPTSPLPDFLVCRSRPVSPPLSSGDASGTH